MKFLSFLIKPASGRCNLRCRYCFYHDISEQREAHDLGMMSAETLELLVREGMALAEEQISFMFQGGEPMLRGLDFYRKLIDLEKQYARPGLRIAHAIQTNGTLITEEWADFFREHHFLVGLSLDGTRELHDGNRVDAAGRGSWNAAVRGLEILKKKQVDFNLLCVVTGAAARRGQAAYQSLKKLGGQFLQFIPCLDPLEEARGSHPFSLSPERYGRFLNTVFDQWYHDWETGRYISVRLFEDYVRLLAGQPAGTCATTGNCGQYFVVEGDGSVYPCDFFVLDQFRMGKLGEQTLAELAQSELAGAVCARGRGFPAQCAGCQWLPLCGGGCQRDWIGLDRNYQCEALRTFFAYAYPRLSRIAALERQASRALRV